MSNWDLAIKIEMEIARIISQQEINGWKFDVEKAKHHVAYLDGKCMELFNRVSSGLGYCKDTTKRTCSRPFNKTGGYSAKLSKLLDGEELSVSGPLTFIQPRLSERAWVAGRLIELGWKPREFTDTGQPQLSSKGEPSPSLMEMDNPIGKELAEWYTFNQRRGTILNRTDPTRGWLNKVRPDGRISARANPCGCNTGRMQHSVVVNVPKADPSVVFGTEMRELFIAEEGYKIVGHDASGLEARMLAHFLDDPALTEIILYGDFHTTVWDTIKNYVYSRGETKNIEYALIYGASDFKLGSMVSDYQQGWSKRRTTQVGSDVRRAIMRGLPALADLTLRVQRNAERGYLLGLDGRKLYVRSPHSALNVLFQGGGAVVMKASIIFLDRWVYKKHGLTLNEAKKLIDQHDEAQWEIIDDKEVIDLYSSLAVKSIVKAGEYFNLRCPLDAEAKVGNNWSETH